MQMEAGLDTGPMIQKVETPIMPSDTGGSLHDRLAEIGSEAVVNTVGKFENGPVHTEIQDNSLTCYAHKLSKEEALINWHQAADVIVKKIKAFNPAPMCYTLLGDSRIRILTAQLYPRSHSSMPGTVLSVNSLGIMVACKENAVVLEQVTIPGKKPMMVSNLLNGKHPFIENYVLASEQ
jgi:methionyl-tRNA formyltransferase